jgi:hypothetical protein
MCTDDSLPRYMHRVILHWKSILPSVNSTIYSGRIRTQVSAKNDASFCIRVIRPDDGCLCTVETSVYYKFAIIQICVMTHCVLVILYYSDTTGWRTVRYKVISHHQA